MVEWRLDCENCRHLTVVGLHDTGPRSLLGRGLPGVGSLVATLPSTRGLSGHC